MILYNLSTVIRTEDIRGKIHLDKLINDLQDKVNKQKTIIENLKRQYINKDEFNTKLKEKGDVLKRQMAFSLQKKIDEQTEMLDLKDKKIEKLKNEVDQMKGKFENLKFNLILRIKRSIN